MFLKVGHSKISGFLTFLLLFSMLVPTWAFGATAAVELKDISGSYAQKEIRSLVDNGIISGYEDGSFQPSKAMSRAELAKIIVLSLGLKEHPEMASAYTDIDKHDWYQGFVGALVESGITQGTSATTFSPNTKVTREELIVFFIRAMGLEETAGKLAVDANLSDIKEVSIWAQAHVSLAFKVGFVNGIENHNGTLKFSPKDNAERQALARLAYEFKTNKTRYIDKGKELANLFEVTSVSAVNNSTVEVTFNSEVAAVNPSDFTFDNGLSVTKAELKADSKTVVVLTTAVQASGTVYKLSYKGKDTGKSVIGLSGVIGGGGGGNGGQGSAIVITPKSDLDKLNSGGTYDSLIITTTGTVGPADGFGKTIVKGTLTLNPGAGGEIMLQNVEAANIVVASGSSNSIKLKNTIITTLKIAATNQLDPVRVESLAGSQVTNTDIQSKVIMESSAGSLGMITIGSGAQGQEIELRGTIKGAVTVEGEGAKIKIAAPKDGGTTSIANLNIGTNAVISATASTSLGQLSITAPNTSVALNGEGAFHSVTVSKEAQGTTLNLSSTITKISAIQIHADTKLEGDVNVIGSIPITASPGVKVEASPTLMNTLKNNAIAAIAAIGQFDTYSLEVDALISAAETMANNAILLGIAQEEITGYSTKLAEAQRLIVIYALEAAYHDLKIGFADKDTLHAVTQNMVLPIADTTRKVSITWSSSNSSVVSSTGLVTRPSVGEADEEVILTALLLRNGRVRNMNYLVTVLAQRNSVPVEPTVPTLDLLSVEPNSITLRALGATQPLSIFAKYSDAAIRNVTKEASYVSSAPTVATVSKEGFVAAVANGTTSIMVSYGEKTIHVPVTVDALLTPPSTPTLQSSAGDGQVSLYWTSVGSNVTYQVYSSKTSGLYTQMPATVTGTTYTVADLDNGTRYYFTVKALDNGLITVLNEVSVIPVADIREKTATPTVSGNVYTNGFLLSGTAQPRSVDIWTTITLTKQDGTYVSGNAVARDGTFSIRPMNTYPNIVLTEGEKLLLTAQAEGKKKSDPVTFFVKATSGQTKIPTVISDVYEATNEIRVHAEPDAFITLKNDTKGYNIILADGSYDGYYSFFVNGLFSIGDQLQLTATVLGKATSNPINFTVKASSKTEKPTVNGNAYTNGFMLSGKAEPGSENNRTSITLTKKDGSYVGGSGVRTDGTYILQSDFYIPDLTLTVGEELLLTAQTEGKKKSDPVSIVVQATTGQTDRVMTDIINETTISGWAPFGSFITIKNDLNLYYMRTYASSLDGFFNLRIQPGTVQIGDQLTLTAAFIGKASSDPIHAIVQAAPKTEKPTIAGSVYPNAYAINGTAEPGLERKWTDLILSKQDGTYITSISVDMDGHFSINDFIYNTYVKIFVGEELQLTAQAYGKKKSDPAKIVVQAVSGQTALPTVTAASEAIISGYAEPGAIVTVKVGLNGFRTSFRASTYDGFFSQNMLPTGLFNAGEQLTITAITMGKATSDLVNVIVQASPKTAMPTLRGNVYTNGFMLNGTVDSESSYTYINLNTQDGSYVGSFNSWLDGTFSTSQLIHPNVTLIAGDELLVTAQANDKKRSDPVKIVVQNTVGQTAVPTILDNKINTNYLSGRAEPGAIVTLTKDSRVNSYTATASAEGNYSIYWPTGLFIVGDQLSLSATQIGKETSDTVHITLLPSLQ